MTTTSLPADYVPRYTHDEVKRRYLYLSERCFVFLNGMTARHPSWQLTFDPLVMANVAISAMDDIWRWKVYHLRHANKLSDAIKRAAYFTKWITRLKPIYFLNRPLLSADFISTFDKNDSTLLINEIFAIHVSLGSLAGEAGATKIILADDVLADLLYDLHYRILGDDALMALYTIVRKVARKEPVIMP